ncbi:class I SAM-dependent methyltransferase [Nocardia terpenica]|uniref:Methyltransferase domain-containing protein n=1 Tax=Nocardia terpenica TaxID=455432 RepID=A0A6G9ZFK8_9NOCA|nr:class I SAM-dependent methyltransferase [Nocardia terpenica]QIS24338.1 methyltransferase domain-containing protein [Nocardia terpenica]
MVGSDRAQANSFGAAATVYAKSRPPYPVEAIRWLVPVEARTVLDLGAGTGQLTRGLCALGVDVVAVEPSEGMRNEFLRALPEIPVLVGRAEQIPLDDDSVDAVVVAQAWHWVDPQVAVPELTRVLRGGGGLGLVWNIRDEREPWVAELGRIMHQGTVQDMSSENPPVGAPFEPIERRDLEWSYRTTRTGLLDLVASRSYLITLAPEAREQVLRAVSELLDTHPSVKGRTEIELPYVTRCSRTRLADQQPRLSTVPDGVRAGTVPRCGSNQEDSKDAHFQRGW